MKRVVERELLDDLPPDDPGAIGSRRDLRQLNRAMGHVAILRDLLLDGMAERIPERIVELGAGDGTLMLQLAKQLSRQWPNVKVVLVDRKDALWNHTRMEFEALGWEVETATADVFDWLRKPGEKSDIMFANLFLHHFQTEELRKLLALAAARAEMFVTCEPRRSAMPLAFSRMVGLIGCNAVTRHDAVLSVRAGFAGTELSDLWPEKNKWQLRERSAGLFTHTFVAQGKSKV